MKRTWFHHPDISIPVLRRKASEELIEFLGELDSAMNSRLHAFATRSCYPSQQSYYNAVYRLRKAGLVSTRREGGRTPQLKLTPKGTARLAPALRPQSRWDRKWNGIWYLVVYDIPEQDKSYRDVLRRFLRNMKMGCLQKSVWVTPHDIRPEFDDLCKGAALDSFAFLFESRTVLGLPAERVVTTAWDFDRLGELQSWYCRTCEEQIERIDRSAYSEKELTALAREAIAVYCGVMEHDPLLPKRLCPVGYQGRRSYRMHRKLMRKIGRSRL